MMIRPPGSDLERRECADHVKAEQDRYEAAARARVELERERLAALAAAVKGASE